MNVNIHPSWKKVLQDAFDSPSFAQLASFVKKEYQSGVIYPPPKNIFRAFDHCPFEAVEVVILGQDPYHGPRQANGLSFAVENGIALPPSLQNIFKEIEAEFGGAPNRSGDLTRWADQGVLLLNATLTVRAGAAGSHQGRGWEELTDAAVRSLSEQRDHVVFMLWGNYARAKGAHIDRKKHLVLESAHPSPFSANHGFFGNGHFRKANDYLVKHGKKPIDWLS